MLSKGFCSHGRSLGAQRGQFGDNQRSLSVSALLFYLYFILPRSLVALFFATAERQARGGGRGLAAYRRRPWRGGGKGAPPTPVRFCGSFERTAEDASPRDKNLFPLEVNGILYDVISCIKEAGSAALLRANSWQMRSRSNIPGINFDNDRETFNFAERAPHQITAQQLQIPE